MIPQFQISNASAARQHTANPTTAAHLAQFLLVRKNPAI